MAYFDKYQKYKSKYLQLKQMVKQVGLEYDQAVTEPVAKCRTLEGLLRTNSCGSCHGESIQENISHYADCDWKSTDPCNKEIMNLGYGTPKSMKPNDIQCKGRSGCEFRANSCQRPCTKIQTMNKILGC